MFNVVELLDNDQQQSPCKWGNIVVGHACYCHNDDWKEGPRKCPIWRRFGTDESKWHRREWPLENSLVYAGPDGERYEKRRLMPDDDIGGCPMFEPASPVQQTSEPK